MKKRRRMSKRKSKRDFKRKAGVHGKNVRRTVGPMRGGIRL